MKKFLILFFCVFGISACSRLDIAVNWADTYISAKVDDYFDITSEQKRALKESLKNDIRRLRKEQFRLWALELQKLQNDLKTNNLDEARFQDHYQRMLANSQKLQPYFTNTASDFIATTTSEQLNHFEKFFRQKNHEEEKKFKTAPQVLRETKKKYLRWTDMFLGPLSKDQERILSEHLEMHPFPARLQIKNKALLLQKIQESRHSPETLKNFVRDYYNDRTQFAATEYQQALKEYQNGLGKFLHQLLTSLSEKQKRTFSENLGEKAALLKKLAAKD